MNRIIVAGHVCLDITPVIPRQDRARTLEQMLPPGKLLLTEGVSVTAGGCVTNTGLALRAMGADVSLMGKVGNDPFGDLVADIFARHGAKGLIRSDQSATSYSVVLAFPGRDRSILHDPAANDTFCADDIPEAALEDAALFHFGYPPLMRRMYARDGEELVRLFQRVRSHGAATSLDLAAVDPASDAGRVDWAALLARVLPQTDFFVPSFEELCFMLDRPLWERLNRGGDMTFALDLEGIALPLARKALDLGCRAVLVKCGASGMVYCTAEAQAWQRLGLSLSREAWAGRVGVQRCFHAQTVQSATGAGDSAIAAFLLALVRGKDPEACVRLAAAQGALAVTRFDTLDALLPLEALEAKIAEGWALDN